MSKNLSKK